MTLAVFDRVLLRRRRDRAAPHFDAFNFLYAAVAEQISDRFDTVRRALPVILDLGAGTSMLGPRLQARHGTDHVISLDMSPVMAARANGLVVAGEEDMLPVAPQSLDAVVANLSLHWVNDLPGALVQIRQALKPDGVFIAALMGGESLRELRSSLMDAEIAVRGGASPRVSPLIDMQDMAGLMQRAGFALPVVDRDTITVDYSSPFTLMRDLRGMGASNATHTRDRRPVPRRMMLEMARLYAEKYPAQGSGQAVTATFDIIYVIGWAPAASQPQPLRPGTATVRLADILGAEEKKV